MPFIYIFIYDNLKCSILKRKRGGFDVTSVTSLIVKEGERRHQRKKRKAGQAAGDNHKT